MNAEGCTAICKLCTMSAIVHDGVWVHYVDSEAYEPDIDDHQAVPMLGTVAPPDPGCATCGHPRLEHYAERGECMFETEAETWACGCHEYVDPASHRHQGAM